MMTLVMEGALDLSSKSVHDDGSKANSPVPSINSDDESHLGDRSVSVSSETDSGRLSAPLSAANPATIPGDLKPCPTSPHSGHGAIGGPQHHSPGDSSPTNRPFKSYPFEPLPGIYTQMATTNASMAAYGFGVSPNSVPFNLFDSAISMSSPIGQYLQQRKRRAEPKQESGSLNNCSAPAEKLSKNSSGINVPEEEKDNSYWERRRKNNEAAKRSRDARRAKEEEIALRAAFLEQENLKLRAQVAILKNETAKLHYMLYNRM